MGFRTPTTPGYRLVVSRGYVQLVRRGRRPARLRAGTRFVRGADGWVEAEPDPGEVDAVDADGDDEWADPPPIDAAVEADIDEALHRRRGQRGQLRRSQMNMRRLFVSLPWELAGPYPALISLTYPGLWQPWVLDGRAWEAHRRAFERRWVRRWNEALVGVWVKEFQASGRPHLHLYVGLPTTMAVDDFARLRERTLQRHRLERQHGRYQGRRHTPSLASAGHGGDFGAWLLEAWSQIVGTHRDDSWQRALDPKGTDHHRSRGADVAVMFWSEEAEACTDRTRVAQYLAREAGKFAQKQPPPGFGKVGRYYGLWGRSLGFQPEITTTAVDPAVAVEVEARLTRWVHWKLAVLRQGAPPTTRLAVRRPGDGLTAFGLGPEQAARILRWSERAAARRQANGRQRDGGGVADPAALLQLLRSADLDTGEMVSPDTASGNEPG